MRDYGINRNAHPYEYLGGGFDPGLGPPGPAASALRVDDDLALVVDHPVECAYQVRLGNPLSGWMDVQARQSPSQERFAEGLLCHHAARWVRPRRKAVQDERVPAVAMVAVEEGRPGSKCLDVAANLRMPVQSHGTEQQSAKKQNAQGCLDGMSAQVLPCVLSVPNLRIPEPLRDAEAPVTAVVASPSLRSPVLLPLNEPRPDRRCEANRGPGGGPTRHPDFVESLRADGIVPIISGAEGGLPNVTGSNAG